MAPRRPRSQLALALAFSYALLAAPQPAAAEPTPAERETARGLMDEADRLRQTGDLRGAMSRYQAAHALMHVPTTGLDLARVQAQLGFLVEARSTASEVIHLPVKPNEPRVFEQARNAAAELFNTLETHVPALKTEVLPSPDYSLIIDGVTLPAQARNLPFRANPGPHSVRVEADGYGAENRQVSLTEGEVQTLTVVLTPIPNAAPPRAVAQAAAVNAPNLSGVTARSDAGDPAAAGRVRGIVGLGVGGAAIALGTVTGLISAGKTNQAKAHCDQDRCQESQRSTLASANTLANVANFAIPIGLLGIAYGLFELLTLPSAPPALASAHGISVDLSPTGVTLRGSL